MNGVEIFGAIVGLTALASLIVCMFLVIHSAEKTEEKKRDLMNEVAKYYRYRNKMFEKEEEK